MIKYTNETVFNVNADCIVNTINCVGFMGKGLALEFALRYPKLNEEYKKQCLHHEIQLGKVYYYEIDNQKIINFPTKYHFMYPSKIEWIEAGLIDFRKKFNDYNIKSIAFPLLGCSNGELSKNDVINVMEKYLNIDDIVVYICDSSLLNGKEKEMLENFKICNIDFLSKYVKLNKIQKINLESERLNIKRFYQILNIDKIGINTYKSIFNHFYNNNNKEEKFQQLDIFGIKEE